jgi:sugar/nucleoside kinase (ribokinase family)
MTRAAAAARARGIPRVADVESDADPAVHGLLALVDHLVLPWGFAQRWTGEEDAAAAVAALWGPDRDTVVVTDGPRGCWYRSGEDPAVHHVPAFAVRVVDTTGCGDVFHGAYAAGLAFGLAAGPRVAFAAAAAALAATGRGGRGALPARAAVEELLASGAPARYNVAHGAAGL